ncbi:hypothetical protein [Pseudomonas aeruginosa]|uniref:hypothetical protein n=1 Tax=Pseudomonas aeruginosa TaxID=287 RepID=UPI003FD21739
MAGLADNAKLELVVTQGARHASGVFPVLVHCHSSIRIDFLLQLMNCHFEQSVQVSRGARRYMLLALMEN